MFLIRLLNVSAYQFAISALSLRTKKLIRVAWIIATHYGYRLGTSHRQSALRLAIAKEWGVS